MKDYNYDAHRFNRDSNREGDEYWNGRERSHLADYTKKEKEEDGDKNDKGNKNGEGEGDDDNGDGDYDGDENGPGGYGKRKGKYDVGKYGTYSPRLKH